MITAKNLLESQRQAPFQPFSIHMSDGRSVDVRHPENIFILKNTALVATPGEDEIGERLSILHMTSLRGVEV